MKYLLGAMVMLFIHFPLLNAETVGARLSYWFVQADIKAQSQNGNIKSKKVDFDNVLDTDDSIGTLDLEAWFRLSQRSRITLEYIPLTFDGDQILSQEVTFDGQLFNIGELIDSEFQLNWFNAFFEFDLINNEYGMLGLRVGGEFLSTTAQVQSDLITAEEDFFVVSPAVGAIGEFYLTPSLGIEIKLDGFKMHVGDYDVLVLDGRGMLKYDLTQNFSLGGGLHFVNLELDVDKDRADVSLIGVFFSGTVQI